MGHVRLLAGATGRVARELLRWCFAGTLAVGLSGRHRRRCSLTAIIDALLVELAELPQSAPDVATDRGTPVSRSWASAWACGARRLDVPELTTTVVMEHHCSGGGPG